MLKKLKKILKFFERIFRFVRDIVDILGNFRYSSSSDPVNYDFLASSEVMIQISSPLGVQGFYHQKEKRNLWLRRCYTSFLSCFEIKSVIQVLYISLLKLSSSFVHSGHNLAVVFGAKFPQIIVVLPLKCVQLSLKTFALLGVQYFVYNTSSTPRTTGQINWRKLDVLERWYFHIWIRPNMI